MTEEEQLRHGLRSRMFERRGLTSDRATRLADTCAERESDLGWRDMHACAECKHLQRGNRCAVLNIFTLPIDTLHRCESFGWQVPRTKEIA